MLKIACGTQILHSIQIKALLTYTCVATTYSRTLNSTSTPPYSAPSDVLLPDMTQDGWTYAYTA